MREYAAKRGRPTVRKAGLKAQVAKSETRKRQAGTGNDPGASVRAKQAKSSKVSSVAAPDRHATLK